MLALTTTCLSAIATSQAAATTIFTNGSGDAVTTLISGCPPGTASGQNAIAIGCMASANGDGAIALGANSQANGANTIAIGLSAGGTGTGNLVLGTSAAQASNGDYNVVLGTAAAQNFTGNYNFIAGGYGGANGVAASATNVNESIVIGPRALRNVSGVTRAVVLGAGASVTGNSADTVAIGTSATGGNRAVALGNGASANTIGVAIGNGALVTGANSVALGAGSTDGGRANVVSVGSSGAERQLINVDAGIAGTDGVNVSQLKGVTDALGGGAGIGPDGSIIAPTYNLGGNTYNNVGDALTNIDGRTTQNTTDITNLDNRVTTVEGDITAVTGDVTNILNGTAGIVRQVGGAPGTGTITVGAETGGTLVDMTGTDGERKVTGVAAGAVAATSLDVVNGSQLHGVSQSIANHLGGGSTVGAGGVVVAPTYNLGGNTYSNVGDALTNIDGRTTQNTTDITNLDNRVTTVEGDITTVTGDVTNILNGTAGIVRQVGGAPGIGTITVGAETGGALVDMTGTDGERKVTGVAAGDVAATSLDAVNGSQLHGVSQSIANHLGGGSTVGAGGVIIGPSYTIQGGSYTTVYDAFASVDGNITTIKTDITNLGNQITGVAADALLWDTNKGAFSAAHGGTVPNKITDIAAGTLSATSTDAVNGSQLYATNQQVEQNTTDIIDLGDRVTTVEGDITSIKTDVTNLDGRVSTVENNVKNITTTVTNQGEQIAALDKASVKYSLDANGDPIDEVKLTGSGSGGPVTIKNVAEGVDDHDAVNVEQLHKAVKGLTAQDNLAVRYTADAAGKPTSHIELTGDGTGSPVTISHLAAGVKDDDAVNYGQIKNQVGYDVDGSGNRTNTITLAGTNGSSVVISNLSDGVKDTDAVNVRQLNGVRQDAYNYTDTKVTELRQYTDKRFDSLSGDIRQVRSEARGGVASAMAAAQLRYADNPGVISIAAGFGGFKDHGSFAGGLGWTSEDQKWRVNGSVGVSLNNGDVAWGVGASYAFD